MNEAILEKARELGELLAQSEEFKTMRALETEASANEEISGLYAQYADLRDEMQALELEDEPDKEAMTNITAKAKKLENKINKLPRMKAVNEARAKFNYLMENVNRMLQVALQGEEADDGFSCASGGCESCSGCSVR